jgi:cytoskeletal protein RodZ
MNDAREETTKESLPRKSRRKNGAWKSGLVLTGLAGVVLGAGYLAGVNAPAVAQTEGQQLTPQAVARTSDRANQAGGQANAATARADSDRSIESEDESEAPATAPQAEDGVVIGFDEQGNPVILRNDGSLQLGGSSAGSQNQFGQQFGGRRSRQFGGLNQQAPNFSGPIGRSRGS